MRPVSFSIGSSALQASAVPTLISVTPNQGTQGSTVEVTLIGTNFVVGATTVNVSDAGVTVTDAVVNSGTSLTANFVIDAAAAEGARDVTVTTAGLTSGPRSFTITLPVPGAPTLTSVSPRQGAPGTTVAVTLTGSGFVVGATTVTVGGPGVTVTNVIVGSATALTASFVLDPSAVLGPRAVTVTTAGGTSAPRGFTIGLPPTLTSVTPNLGTLGTIVAVTLTGTNFAPGATVVNVDGDGATATNVIVGSTTSLTATVVIESGAAVGARDVTVRTSGGLSGAQTFTIEAPPAPTLISVSPNSGIRGETIAVTLTGTNFVLGDTIVAVAGGGIAVNNVIVGSNTSLTANFVLDLAAAEGPRTVTVTTPGGTSGPQNFTVRLPLPGSHSFDFTGGPASFVVPAGVTSIQIEAYGGPGGNAAPLAPGVFGNRGDGGRVYAIVAVTPGATLSVRVGGPGRDGVVGSIAAGGFNGGGGSTGDRGGGGGGATDVYAGTTPLVIAGGGGGSGYKESGGGGNGGDGGGLEGRDGEINPVGGLWGSGGTRFLGGAGGSGDGSATASAGTAGTMAGTGGTGGSSTPGVLGGGGGGGGYRGGGGGGGGTPGSGGGGGGSSFTAPGATNVIHQQGVSGGGFVLISW